MAARAAISGGSHSKTMPTPTGAHVSTYSPGEKQVRGCAPHGSEFERFAEAAVAVRGKSMEM